MVWWPRCRDSWDVTYCRRLERETRVIEEMVTAGVVDGTTGDAVPTVDGFNTEQYAAQLARLHRLVDGA